MKKLYVSRQRFFIVPRWSNKKVIWGKGYLFTVWDVDPIITDRSSPILMERFAGKGEDLLYLKLSGEVVDYKALMEGDFSL